MKIIKNCIALLCLLTVMILPIQALAAGAVDTSEKCSLTVSFPVKDTKASNVQFNIYRIADISSSADFSVTQNFSFYPVSPDMYNNSDNWRSLAQTLSGYVTADNIKADYFAKTNENAQVVFSDIPVGLYLVTGAQFVSDETVYIPQSFIISVPNSDINNEWKYDISVEVKYDTRTTDEDIDIEVLKIWKDNAIENRPVSVAVEIYKDKELYDTVILSKDNNWKFEMKHLNANSVWNVKEKSEADGYTVSVEQQNNHFVLTNTHKNKLPPTPSKPNEPRLPQTGLLWWPVPYMLIGGLSMMIIGIICRRGVSNES